MILVKILLGLSFLMIFFQDYKDRMVYGILFPVVALLCGFLFYKNTIMALFLNSLKINLSFISVFILITVVISNCWLKKNIKNTMGLGDILLFIALSFTFSSVAFILFFICSLIFSLTLHIYINRKHKQKTSVPLAGYMSLFFLIIYITNWFGVVNIIYKI